MTAEPQLPQLPPLLDPPLLSPMRLIATLRLQPIGSGMRAGRKVISVHARPLTQWQRLDGLSLEFEFDAEHGTMLRRAALQEGRCVQLTEAVTIRYDVPIDPVLFEFPEERQQSDAATLAEA